MKTSPAISDRQPAAHSQGGGRAELNAPKKLRLRRKQQPPECVSLWKTGKESELSTLVKETHAFPKQPELLWVNRNRSRMGIGRYEHQF